MSTVLALLAVLWTPQVCEPTPAAMACWPGICCNLASDTEGPSADGWLCEGSVSAVECDGAYSSCGDGCGENDCFAKYSWVAIRACCSGGANA